MIASDGWGQGPVGVSSAHPRNYGSFPRVIGNYAREKDIISLPQAIKKMTSQPAEHFQIKDRGVLEKGKFADITIFNYRDIKDTATFAVGNQKPVGIEYVLVNGKVAVENGTLTGVTSGRILRRV
jgi:N-acyl-D-amino-acid deacylase